MSTEPDPQQVREIARNIVLDHAKDIEYLSIGEHLADFDEFSSLPEDESERVAALVDERDCWRTEVLELRARVAELEARPTIQIKPGRELTNDEVQALTDRFTMPAGRIAFLAASRPESATDEREQEGGAE